MNEEKSRPDAPAYELFVHLLTRHEPVLRRFVRSLLPSWGDVDEVMQRVALSAWKKFGQFDPATDFLKWSLVIARYDALAFRRAMARDRHVFSDEFIEQLAQESANELDEGMREEQALSLCLDKLPPARRELMLQAYADATDQREMALALGKTPAALYMLLSRIRRELAMCIQSALKSGASA